MYACAQTYFKKKGSYRLFLSIASKLKFYRIRSNIVFLDKRLEKMCTLIAGKILYLLCYSKLIDDKRAKLNNAIFSRHITYIIAII